MNTGLKYFLFDEIKSMATGFEPVPYPIQSGALTTVLLSRLKMNIGIRLT